jgi:D-cysteine desulfhydrase
MGVERIKVVPGGSDIPGAMQSLADDLARQGRKGYIIPGGGSNALGALGYVAAAQEILAQTFEKGLRIDRIVLASGSSGTHAGMVVGLHGFNADIPVIGIGVSRDPAQQQPLVMREAEETARLLGLHGSLPPTLVATNGEYWRPKYSVPNARMVEAVQMLARTEAILLDPTYTGKAMAGLIGLARQGVLRKGENVLFLHTGGLPALYASMPVVLGEEAVED